MSEDILIFGFGGRERYALAISQVREIIKLGPLNQVPGACEYMLGLARVRDLYVPVIDTKAILFRQVCGAVPSMPVMALVLDEQEPIALSVQEVSQVMKSTQSVDSQAVSGGRFVEGVIHDAQGLIQKLSAAEIIGAFRRNNVAPVGGVQHAA
ncbi:chemotaxis protein CheW [Pseudomonas taiwanensis]|uniref:chemotaxis protein CheW n=1 Tax=Pseudomonas taiwanensis TaxID=470150 RepID=UPI0028DFA9DA|nr:chemotaxis protein CheW [Pseudomonas taiwanensis]MDT8924678.1 chemotaxis protein CheW [Pseudomonas taiwanensis]